jgi:chromosome segregation ATPase
MHTRAPCTHHDLRQIMNMKPPEILSLLEEASGTKLYERKKEGAMKTLAKKQTKLDEIDEVRQARTRGGVCRVVPVRA